MPILTVFAYGTLLTGARSAEVQALLDACLISRLDELFFGELARSGQRKLDGDEKPVGHDEQHACEDSSPELNCAHFQRGGREPRESRDTGGRGVGSARTRAGSKDCPRLKVCGRHVKPHAMMKEHPTIRKSGMRSM